MSIPYSTAAGLIFGKAGLQEFSEEMVKNQEILELAKKIHVTADKDLSDVFPDVQAAIVDVTAKGQRYSKRVDFPKGEPENPLDAREFRERYDELMRYAGIKKEASAQIFDLVYKETACVSDVLSIFEGGVEL